MVAARIPDRWVDGIAITVALLIATSVSMVFGEMLAKEHCRGWPGAYRPCGGRSAGHVLGLFTPLIRLTNGTASWVLKRFGIEPADEPEIRPFAAGIGLVGADLCASRFALISRRQPLGPFICCSVHARPRS